MQNANSVTGMAMNANQIAISTNPPLPVVALIIEPPSVLSIKTHL